MRNPSNKSQMTGTAIAFIAGAAILSGLGIYFYTRNGGDDDDDNGGDVTEWTLINSVISFDGADDPNNFIEVNDDNNHKLGASYSIKNHKYNPVTNQAWTTRVTVYDETNGIAVGSEEGNDGGAEAHDREQVNISKVLNDRIFTIKIWANQSGNIFGSPNPPMESVWPASSSTITTGGWALLDVLTFSVNATGGGLGFIVEKAITSVNGRNYINEDYFNIDPSEDWKIGLDYKIRNGETSLSDPTGWSTGVTVYNENTEEIVNGIGRTGLLGTTYSRREEMDLDQMTVPTIYTIKLWASQKGMPEPVPDSYFANAITDVPEHWAMLDKRQITLAPDIEVYNFSLIASSLSINEVNQSGTNFVAGDGNIKLGMYYKIKAPTNESVWNTNMTIYDKTNGLKWEQSENGSGEETEFREEVNIGTLSKTISYIVKVFASLNSGFVDTSYYSRPENDAPEGWVCLSTKQVTFTVEDEPGSTIAIITYPIGGGRVEVNPDKDVYKNEIIILTAYPTPPIMGSTETFEFNYWVIFVTGEMPEQSGLNPLTVWMGDTDIDVQAHFKRTHW